METEANLDRKEYSLSNNNYSHREECDLEIISFIYYKEEYYLE